MRASRLNVVTLVVALVVAGGAFYAWLLWASALPPVQDTYRVKAVVPFAGNLGKGARVTVAGLPVGRVESVRRSPAGAVLDLSIDEEHAPLPTDTRFGLRLRTAIGENYVELYPGRSRVNLPDGGALPMGQAQEYVNVDEILDALRPPARERARRMVQALGAAVDGQGRPLNRLVRGVSGVIRNAEPVTRVLANRRRELARLTDELGTVTAAIGQRGDALAQTARTVRLTTESVAARDDALREMLSRLPGTLRQVRRTTDTIRGVTGTTAPVLTNLGAAVQELRPSVRRLRPAAQEGREVVRELGRAAPPLTGTLRRLISLSGPAATTLPQLRKVLCQVNPAAEYLRAYDKEITGVLYGMGSTANYYDANGHAARLLFAFGEGSLKAFDQPTSKVIDTLLDAGVIGEIHNFGYNPIPDPGQAGEHAGPDTPRGPKHVKKPYPRIKAEC